MKTALEMAGIALKKLKILLIAESLLEIAFMAMCIVPQWAVIQIDDGSSGGLRERMLTFHDVGYGFSRQGAALDLIVVGAVMLFLMWTAVWKPDDMDKKRCFYLIPIVIQLFIMVFTLVKYLPVEVTMRHGHLLPTAYLHIVIFFSTILVGAFIPFFIMRAKRSIKEAGRRETAGPGPDADPK